MTKQKSDPKQVVHLESLSGGKGTAGSIDDRCIEIVCQSCGNDNLFHGIARVYPAIVIRRHGSAPQYYVDSVEYDSTGVDEVPVRCARCGSPRLCIQEQDPLSVFDDPDSADHKQQPKGADGDLPF